MKYCTHCGKELCDEAVICPGCGCSVGSGKVDAVKQAVTGGMSTLALVGFILSLFTLLVGLILSILAFNRAKEEGDEKSKTFSKAGIIISSVRIGLVILLFVGIGSCVLISAAMYPY